MNYLCALCVEAVTCNNRLQVKFATTNLLYNERCLVLPKDSLSQILPVEHCCLLWVCVTLIHLEQVSEQYSADISLWSPRAQMNVFFGVIQIECYRIKVYQRGIRSTLKGYSPVFLFQPKHRSCKPENKLFYYLKQYLQGRSMSKMFYQVWETKLLLFAGAGTLEPAARVSKRSERVGGGSDNIAQTSHKMSYFII